MEGSPKKRTGSYWNFLFQFRWYLMTNLVCIQFYYRVPYFVDNPFNSRYVMCALSLLKIQVWKCNCSSLKLGQPHIWYKCFILESVVFLCPLRTPKPRRFSMPKEYILYSQLRGSLCLKNTFYILNSDFGPLNRNLMLVFFVCLFLFFFNQSFHLYSPKQNFSWG